MNIYEAEGTDAIVDLRAAAAELKSVGSITSESARKAAVAEITAATLLDIALSLRVVAAEARAAMPSPFAELDTMTDAGAEDGERDFFIEGDLVVVDGMDEPGEIKSFGQSEGALYAVVLLANGAETRAWLDSMHRLVGDERDDDTMQEASETTSTIDPELARLNAAADAEGEIEEPAGEDVARELASDIDDDFDGDHHTAAASALDVLKANEAERKAAKKKGSKK